MKVNLNDNTPKFLTGLFVCFFLSFTVNSQQYSRELKSLVLFDPIPWKNQLNLNVHQCEMIEKINLEFYKSLNKIVHDRVDDRSVMLLKASHCLLQRSDKIRDVFHPAQRRKWGQLWNQYYKEKVNPERLDGILTPLLSESLPKLHV